MKTQSLLLAALTSVLPFSAFAFNCNGGENCDLTGQTISDLKVMNGASAVLSGTTVTGDVRVLPGAQGIDIHGDSTIGGDVEIKRVDGRGVYIGPSSIDGDLSISDSNAWIVFLNGVYVDGMVTIESNSMSYSIDDASEGGFLYVFSVDAANMAILDNTSEMSRDTLKGMWVTGNSVSGSLICNGNDSNGILDFSGNTAGQASGQCAP